MEIGIKYLKDLCKKYIKSVLVVAKLDALVGCIIYCSENNKRIDIHKQICKFLGVSHCDKNIKEITDNLGSSIGLCLDYDYDDEEIEFFADKLVLKIKEL